MNAIRVLHLSAGNLYGGVERLLSTLAGEAWRCPTMAPEFGLCFEGRLAEELREQGAVVHALGAVRLTRPSTVWRARNRLKAVLSSRMPDAVVCHACWPHVVFAPVAKRAGKPLVFWAHDVHRGVHVLERWAQWTPPDTCIANSRFTLASLDGYFGSAPQEVVYCPVSPPPLSCRRATIRQDLATGLDDVVIVIASRLERWKGHAALLGALGRLTHLPNWSCWIAGGPQRPQETSYLEELRLLAGRHGLTDRVRFAGLRGDVPALLRAADIHCQPNSSPEPFGLAFVEALLAGLPVVTYSHGGPLEIIDDDTGVLVSPGDEKALAAALARLIDNPGERSRLGANGPKQASLLCDPGRQLSQLDSILRRTAVIS